MKIRIFRSRKRKTAEKIAKVRKDAKEKLRRRQANGHGGDPR